MQPTQLAAGIHNSGQAFSALLHAVLLHPQLQPYLGTKVLALEHTSHRPTRNLILDLQPFHLTAHNPGHTAAAAKSLTGAAAATRRRTLKAVKHQAAAAADAAGLCNACQQHTAAASPRAICVACKLR
jgi:hypothetical protein